MLLVLCVSLVLCVLQVPFPQRGKGILARYTQTTSELHTGYNLFRYRAEGGGGDLFFFSFLLSPIPCITGWELSRYLLCAPFLARVLLIYYNQ